MEVMKKKIIVVIIIFILTTLSYFGYLAIKKFTTPENVHYHAGFVVFQNDKKIDFSDFKYMRVKPCLLDESNHDESPEDIQSEKAHLHDNVGDVVHIEGEGTIWKDLFTNIKYDLDYTSATTYINGKKVSNFENLSVQPDDSIVILTGDNKSDHLKDAVSKKYIEEKAAKSVDCGE